MSLSTVAWVALSPAFGAFVGLDRFWAGGRIAIPAHAVAAGFAATLVLGASFLLDRGDILALTPALVGATVLVASLGQRWFASSRSGDAISIASAMTLGAVCALGDVRILMASSLAVIAWCMFRSRDIFVPDAASAGYRADADLGRSPMVRMEADASPASIAPAQEIGSDREAAPTASAALPRLRLASVRAQPAIEADPPSALVYLVYGPPFDRRRVAQPDRQHRTLHAHRLRTLADANRHAVPARSGPLET